MFDSSTWERLENLVGARPGELVEFMKRVEKAEGLVSSWVFPGAEKIRASALADDPFTNLVAADRDASLSVPHNTLTAIGWEAGGQGAVKINYTGLDNDRLYLVEKGRHVLEFSGFLDWGGSGGTGERGVRVAAYTEADVLYAWQTPSYLGEFTSANQWSPIIPFVTTYTIRSSDPISHFRIMAYQWNNTAATYNLNYAKVDVKRINEYKKAV